MWVVALNIFNDKIYIFGDDDRQRALFPFFSKKGLIPLFHPTVFPVKTKNKILTLF